MTDDQTTKSELSTWILVSCRWILPGLVCLAGLIAVVVNPSTVNLEGAAGLIGAGLSWMLLGFLFRVGVRGDEEREVEYAAREYLDEHGRWPTDEEYANFERHGAWAAPERDRVMVGA